MDFSNINDKDIARLEQACERYAVMAFEAINGRLAIDLKSIRYSYEQCKDISSHGIFSASFIPTHASDCPRNEDRRIDMSWRVCPTTAGRWRLFNGQVTVQNQPVPYTVNWYADGVQMVFSGADVAWVYSPKISKSTTVTKVVNV